MQRWLKAPLQLEDGTLKPRERGSPQRSAISPVLANLFLHYALDLWLVRESPEAPFERYADDGILHCKTKQVVQIVLDALIERLAQVGTNLLLDQFASTETIGEQISLFKAECETHDRAFDPMDVATARNLYVARDADDATAAVAQQAGVHNRMIERSRGPDGSNRSHIMAYANKAGGTEAHALFGPRPDIIAGLQAPQAVGVRYVLISGGETRQSIQRFAPEVMPAVLNDS